MTKEDTVQGACNLKQQRMAHLMAQANRYDHIRNTLTATWHRWNSENPPPEGLYVCEHAGRYNVMRFQAGEWWSHRGYRKFPPAWYSDVDELPREPTELPAKARRTVEEKELLCELGCEFFRAARGSRNALKRVEELHATLGLKYPLLYGRIGESWRAICEELGVPKHLRGQRGDSYGHVRQQFLNWVNEVS